MQIIEQFFANRTLMIGLLAWVVAQTMKFIIYALVTKKIDFSRLLGGLGGMPSTHSATICAVATAVGLTRGFDTVEFAISCVLAIVIMTDAAGVRRAAGNQAKRINQIVANMIRDGKGFTGETLKEFLGHTPFEVLVGALVGILVTLIVM